MASAIMSAATLSTRLTTQQQSAVQSPLSCKPAALISRRSVGRAFTVRAGVSPSFPPTHRHASLISEQFMLFGLLSLRRHKLAFKNFMMFPCVSSVYPLQIHAPIAMQNWAMRAILTSRFVPACCCFVGASQCKDALHICDCTCRDQSIFTPASCCGYRRTAVWLSEVLLGAMCAAVSCPCHVEGFFSDVL